jgi:hypothetical protein
MLIGTWIETNNLILNILAKLFLINSLSINNNGLFEIQKYVVVI